ncbi:sulfatase-like hydrolase/transferase [Blastopirellula marina]|uniref:Arylsulfatase n=1 Tax=Blastopirellula marina TaxID=124 RepID=A0A2S8GT06_9BACT|nr:sulfatase-like hydrolase/transferase [Blastopirellula marina]PQO47555.1 arylsulfatase [Blastopirellula marina]
MARIPFFAALASLLFCGVATAAERPNIIVFLADDLGIECVESYGGLSYKTPNIDRLAASGMRFTHCFADPYCSPSRAQLLTGRYPLHNGIPRVIFLPDQHREFLDPAKETSVAKLLKNAGYATAMAGKWQLSFLEERDTIRDHGFDEYQAWQIFDNGKKTSRYASPTMRQNGEVISTPGGYGPDENLAFVTDFIERHQDEPFLVYYACLLPHWPWEPTPDSDVPLSAGKGDGDPKYMKDMVSYLDKQVGAVAATLDRLNLRDNTVLIFVADNGTDQRLKTEWTDGSVERLIPGGKSHMTDTGTRVPMIVSWPGTIQAGSVNNDLVDLSDLLPTLVELGNADPSPQPINGVSFAPQLRGETGQPRTWIHVQKESQRHVRNREFILNNQGKLRPVVEYGLKPAQPISPDSSEAAEAAQQQLKAALKEAATFGKSAKP